MTSDAYTNITTVKLFSHSREVGLARHAMQDFLGTVFRQMPGQRILRSSTRR